MISRARSTATRFRSWACSDRDIKISRNDGESGFSEITTIAESPIDPKVLWVGTDDGNVQVSQDGGATWRETSAAITSGAGIANGSYVARIVSSGASRGTAFVAFDSHRSGDFAPYIARTTDFGKTWKSVTSGLAARRVGAKHHEYPGKANVVFAGTERVPVRDHRQRRALVAHRRESADDAIRRHPHPSAHERSRARHARPKYLDSRRRIANRRVVAGDRRESHRICSRRTERR